MNNKIFLKKDLWGKIDDQPIFLFHLTNANGMKVSISNYGAMIQSIEVPTKNGNVETTLGFNTLEEYLSEEYRANYPYFGVVIGRNAGRIKGGKTTLNGEPLQLTVNHNGAQLHGGFEGFDRKVWEVVSTQSTPLPEVTLQYISPDGEEGYPGEVVAQVTYSLNANNELKVEYHATTNQPTIVNLTQHAYFNFSREGGDILNHKLCVNASRYSPLNPDYSPTGELLLVEGTPLDYRTPSYVNEEIDNAFPREVSEKEIVGSLFCEETKLLMEVETNQPVLHIYGGYYVPELQPKGRKKTGKNTGICFECQGFADALNYPQFQTTQLNPEEEYSYFAIFRFKEVE